MAEYDPKYIDEMIAFFSKPPYREVEVKYKNRFDKEGVMTKTVPNDFPMMSEFARTIGVTSMDIKNWIDEHPDFKKAAEVVKDLQAEFLIQNALRGFYHANFAKATAENVIGWKDSDPLLIKGQGILIYLPALPGENDNRTSKQDKVGVDSTAKTGDIPDQSSV